MDRICCCGITYAISSLFIGYRIEFNLNELEAMADLTTEASLSLGDSYQIDENYSEAVDCYAAAISFLRDSEMALHIRALSHRSKAFFQMERYTEALEDANKALELFSTRPSGLRPGEGEICHKRAGLAALKLEKFAKAKEAFQHAAQLASLNNRYKTAYITLIEQCDTKLKPSSGHVLPASKVAEPTTERNQAAKIEVASKDTDVEAEKSVEAAKVTNSEKTKTVGTLQPNNSSTGALAPGAKRPTMPKYQYYQSDKFMTISILETGVKEEDIHVNFGTKQLTVILRKQGVDFTVIANNLYTEIVVEKSKMVIKDEKVLIKLKKESEKYEWHELFGKNDETKFKPSLPPRKKPNTVAADPKPRPYASPTDWDKVEKDLKDEEKNEKPTGDNAMNKFFEQIYSNADEETRRAMIKSYQTSGGTVLSCNWDEVKNKDYEGQDRVAPKGQEWKNWEGKKLPMKEDD
jgi:suppressor of G2 allele of SKP1